MKLVKGIIKSILGLSLIATGIAGATNKITGDFNGDGNQDALNQPINQGEVSSLTPEIGVSIASFHKSWTAAHPDIPLITDWSAESYGAFSANLNANSPGDEVLLLSHNQFILLHGDIITPIFIPKAVRNAIVSWDANGLATYTSFDLDADPDHFEVKFGDFDGDGTMEIFLQGKSLGSTSYILNGDGSISQTLSNGYQGLDWSAAANSLVIQDLNGDGIDDIKAFSQIAGEDDRLIYMNNGQVDYYDVVGDNTVAGFSTGVTSGEFRVNEQGGATYSIPISLPSGTAGVTPQISLGYSSQGGDGVMGVGWSLSAGSAISRCPKTIAQDGVISGVDFSRNDRFCINGQRLKLTSGVHGQAGAIYYSEIDSFSKVEAHGSATDNGPLGFTVETKSGEVHYYGYVDAVTGANAITLRDYWNNSEVGADAFIEPKGKASKSIAQSYMLKAIKDVSGNYILFEYIESNGVANVDRVSYTGNVNSGQKPYAYAKMNYSTKATMAKRSGYMAGSAILQDKLLNSIHVILNDQAVHYYSLSYFVPALAEEKYTLESIQECTDATQTDCYPATTFDWHKPVPSNQTTQEFCNYNRGEPVDCFDQTVSADFNPFGYQSGKLINGSDVNSNRVIDMNGDGYSDIVYTDGGSYRVAFGGPQLFSSRSLTTIGENNKQYLLNIDYNGDGKRDLLVANSESSVWNIVSFEPYTYTTQICEPAPGDGQQQPLGGEICFPQEVTTDLKVASIGRTAIGVEGKAQVLDIDGNGLEDIVYQSGNTLYWYKNNGGTFAAGQALVSFNSANPNLVINSTIEKNTANMLNASGIDVNGDGRSDLVIHVTDSGSTCTVGTTTVYALNSLECVNEEGGVWTSFSNTGWRLYISDGSSLIQSQDLGNFEDMRVADLNGDGLTDVLQYSYDSVWSYRLADGRGFLGSRNLPHGTTTDTYKNQSYFIDLNGDGSAEFLKATSSTNWNIYVSQYASDETISMVYRGNIARESGAAYQFGDVNGDAKLDFLQGKSNSTFGWRVNYAPRGGKPDYVIRKFTNGFGISTDVFYRPMTDTSMYLFSGADADLDYTTFSPTSGMPLVRRVESDTKTDARVAIDYEYGGFLVNRQGRGMLGFELVRTIDNTTLIETETVYKQIFPHIGMPLATRQLLTDGRVIADASNVLANKTTVNGQNFPYIQSSSEKSWSVGSDNVIYEINRTNSSFTYDTYGNLTDSTVTVSDHYGNNDLETKTVNAFTGTSWEKSMGRLKSTTVTKKRNYISISRKSDFTYYPQSDPTHSGMLKTSNIWSDSTTKSLLTSYEYDAFGNKSKVTKTGAENSDGTNIQNRVAQSVYGSDGRLVDYTIDSANIKSSYLYNGFSASQVSGRVAEITTTVNDISQTNIMDSWGRTIQSTIPGGSDVFTDYEFCTVVSCDSSGGYFRIRTSKAGAPEKRVYFDTFGREIESRVKSFSNGWNIIRREYDSQGRENKTYEPTTATTSTYFTQPTYDVYGRVIQITRPDTTTVSTEYYGLKTKSFDAKGNESYSWQNEQGELKKTVSPRIKSWLVGNTLNYTYDPYGNLLNVHMSNQEALSTTKVVNIFDAYGHKTQTNDTDKGIWNYEYNAFDELVKQTTAKSQSSVLDYDVAGRLIRRYEPEGTSCWNYDASTGRLTNEKVFNNVSRTIAQCGTDTTENYRKSYFYDTHGRVEQTDVALQNVNANVDGTYMTTTSFDQYGRVWEVVYPNLLSVENVYANGYLDKLINADTPTKVYQNIDSMNAYGQVTGVTYANGAQEIIAYQANNGRVKAHALSKGGVNKHYLNYQYDDNANITYRRHEFNDKGYTDWNETLTYDNLNRLDYRNVTITDNSYLTAGFQSDQDYNYDDWGNLTAKYGVGNYTYDTTKKNRLLSTTGTKNFSMSYDLNGNITNDGTGRNFTYSSFDKVNRITKGSLYSEFQYGSNRARYYKHDRRTESSLATDYYTAYVGAYEKIHRTGGGKTALTEHKVNLGNIVITERSDGTSEENYLHKDHLGSTISVTDKLGAIVQQFTYDPWGKQTKIYQQSNYADLIYSQPTNRGYTGHEHIRDLDIIHMNGRIYDADLGRFLQADPNIQSVGNFQNYNRYSYVLNNPLSLTDPSGFFFKKLFKSIKKYWRQVVSIVLTATLGPLGSFIGTYLTTGSLRSALIGAVLPTGGGDGLLGFLSSGAIGGVSTVLQGGKFGRGFLSAGIGNSLGSAFKGVKSNWGKVFASAVVGGTVSRLSGGKFANGAYGAAFATVLKLDWSSNQGGVTVTGQAGDNDPPPTDPNDPRVVKPEIDWDHPYETPAQAREALNTSILEASATGNSRWEYGGLTVTVETELGILFFNTKIVTSESSTWIAWKGLPSINRSTPIFALHHLHPLASGTNAMPQAFSDGDINTYNYLNGLPNNNFSAVFLVDSFGVRAYQGGGSYLGISCSNGIAHCAPYSY